MIVTTYNIVRSEGGVVSGQKGSSSAVDHSKQVSLLIEKNRCIASFFVSYCPVIDIMCISPSVWLIILISLEPEIRP
jgi:hypothetical protein